MSMSMLRLLFLFALAFGSVLPHCASAVPTTQAVSHHVGMAHDKQQPSKAHASDACIGCATPVRMSLPVAAVTIAPSPDYLVFRPTLTTRVTALDPPPPRPIA